jgi:hypothetical protein
MKRRERDPIQGRKQTAHIPGSGRKPKDPHPPVPAVEEEKASEEIDGAVAQPQAESVSEEGSSDENGHGELPAELKSDIAGDIEAREDLRKELERNVVLEKPMTFGSIDG